MRAHGRRLVVVAALALVAGCITPKPPVRYEKALRVAVALVRDDVHRNVAEAVPEPFRAALDQELRARNLVPVFLEPASFRDAFGRIRDTDRRLEHLGRAAAGADALLLVETQAVFYSQLNGIFRWTVYVKVSVAGAGATRPALTRQSDLPAALSFGHEAEPEALAAVAPEAARQAAALLDSYLGGRRRAGAAPAVAGADSIYFVLVDRFQNGDPGNDGAVDRADPAGWHGGDLKGVRERLDYLQRLGVRTIWLSPVFQSRHGPFLGHGAFHGYWVEDLRRLDPRFGTVADLTALADDLHRRGMRLLLDLVVNHVGYEAPLLREHPDWFHPPGTIRNWNDPEEVVTHEVHGLPDLAQERPAVQAYLLGAAEQWLRIAAIDGYRLDAVKHVPLAFWSRFNGALEARHPGITLLGELFDGAPAVVERVQRVGRFTHMFDFPTAFALRDVFCGGRPAGRLGAVLSTRRSSPDPARLVTFLDNHDMPRIRTACHGDLGRVKAALTAQLALEGVPALTYGTEAGLEGGPEPLNRGDMRFDPPAAGDLKAHVVRLLALRREHEALAAGTTRLLGLDGGLLTFARVAGDEAALVAINSDATPRPIPLPAAFAAAAPRDALTGVPAGGRPQVGPGATRVLLARAPRAGGLADLGVPAAARRRVRFSVAGPPLAPREALLVVGSGPELGNWTPASGAGPLRPQGGRLVADLRLPVGVIFAYKLVVRAADGALRWEPGEDRYVFVGPGDGPLALDLTLRRG